MNAVHLAHGRSSEVYEYAGDRVIKVFHPDIDDAQIDQEVRDSLLVHRLGATPIGCHGEGSLDGRRGIVFDRVHGIALTSVAEKNILALGRVSRTLAAEHVKLHGITSDELPDVREYAVGLLATAPFAELSDLEREQLAVLLRELPDGRAILHLDFHPQNVFTHDAGHAVIDWQATCAGHPAADVAMTRFLFTEAELFPGTPPLKKALYTAVRRVMLRFYLREYQARTGLTDEQIEQWATAVRVLRLGILDVPSEHDSLLEKIRGALR